MLSTKRTTRVLGIGIAASVLTFGLGVGLSTAGATTKVSSPRALSKNWTIQLANFAPASPNFIYPMMDAGDFTSSNSTLQLGLYRPLYWFGTATGKVDINPALSLAALPVMSNGNRTATIHMKKNYKWSNGAPVQARDVMEWLNLAAAYPSWWGNYSPPVNGMSLAIPDIVKTATAPNSGTLVLNFYAPVSAHWLLFNPLSNITALPQAWDVMARGWTPGSPYTASSDVSKAGGHFATQAAGCWSTKFIGDGNTTGPTKTYLDPNGSLTIIHSNEIAMAKKCTEVIATMDSFASDTTNYVNMSTSTGKIWSVVDGPWKLNTWNAATYAFSEVRNPHYGGTAAFAKGINYIPCQSVTGDCYNLLLSGRLTVGGLPSTFASPITSLAQAKYAQIPTLASHYKLQVGYDWAIGYNWFNFTSTQTGAQDDSAMSGDTTPRSALFAQSYITRAMNDAYPAKTIINTAYRGYAYPIFGPIPPYPANTFTSLKSSPYALSKVAGEMDPHGWTKVGGIYTCTSPGTGSGNCGAGIGQGATMTFRVDSASAGDTQGQTALQTWVSAAKTVGINLIPNVGTFTQVIANDTAASTKWDMTTGSGWIYAPSFYPSGEPLFLTGASSNSGSYSNPTNDKNIIGTITGSVSLDKYERYLANNPPVVWDFWVVRLREIAKNVGGYVYPATGYSTPESWYLTK